MAMKSYRPITPARHWMTNLDSSDITSKPTLRALLKNVPRSAGRNSNGRITSRHREAGAKKLYRIIDFKRNKFNWTKSLMIIKWINKLKQGFNLVNNYLLHKGKDSKGVS